MISPGSFIGNYRILSPLSSDAVSQLYLTENTTTHGAPVALRVWNSVRLATPQERDGFLREAQELTKLRHPYIVSTLDTGIQDDHPYIVSEYIYSTVGTLQNRIQRQAPQPFSQAESLSILAQIGQALSYAHHQNILHRQLSPTHILFNPRGEALLGDFGLATIQDALVQQQTGETGPLRQTTDLFQAPEQQLGTVRRSKLGDQYALGSIAYILLTGYPPSQPLIAPTQRNSFLPIFIERAILKALSPQLTERYPSVDAFLAALGAIPDEGTVVNHSFNAFPISPQPPIPASPTPFPAVAQEQVFLPSPYVGLAPTPTGEQRMEQVVRRDSGTIEAPAAQWTGAAISPPGPMATPPPQGPIRPLDYNDPNKKKRTRRFVLIALLVVLLLVLSSLGAFAYTLIPAGSAVVTLTPATQRVGNTYNVSLVSGQADATQGQVAAHVISFSAKPQTKTVPATGKGHQNATSATGTLTITGSTQNTGVASGQTLTTNSGVQIITDAPVQLTVGGTSTVPAHAANPGSGGNIPAYDLNGTYNVVSPQGQFLTTVTIQNTTPFSGGQDAADFTYVQQSDLDNVSNPLVPQLTTEAQNGAQQQVGANEKLAGNLQCNPVVTPDHKVNDHATNVTVQVTVKCVGEAYTDQQLQAMAVTLLKADAAQKLGSNYALAGNAVTGTPTLGNVDTNGNATFGVKVDSIWAFQFSNDQKQQMARAIAGKTVSDSTTILQRFTGISKVSIQTGGFGSALPSNPQNITFNATSVAGLH